MHYLDHQLCVQLYIKTRSIIRFHESHLKSLGLTYPKSLILLALDEKAPCFIDELSTRLLLDIGTLSPLLKRMAQEGLVERRRDHEDERRVFISLTVCGQDKIQPIKEIFEKTAKATCLPLSEKEKMLQMLTRIF